MFRAAVLRSMRAPVGARIACQQPIRSVLSMTQIKPTFIRTYSAPAGLTREDAKERVLELLEGYDKIDATKEIKEDASFVQDLGLDSLDVVEVVMELEHEFNIQIPDNEADSIKTVGQAIDYVLSQPDSC
ncbi:mitochondrial acyl carrier protein [Scheffersomyces amazonensis]|uniref:mitochondrial acyl carrier protein n=1 Tax=Scheffersomyces amazonensis TaxID=1078765 RepID=UPI00315D550B